MLINVFVDSECICEELIFVNDVLYASDDFGVALNNSLDSPRFGAYFVEYFSGKNITTQNKMESFVCLKVSLSEEFINTHNIN